MTSGRPCVTKTCLSSLIVVTEIALCVGKASIQREYASTMTKSIQPSTGPAESMCTRVHGLEVIGHAFTAAFDGACAYY